MSVGVVVFFVVLGGLFLPITVRGSFSFDIVSNEGAVSVLFYRLKIFRAKLSVSSRGILLEGKKKSVIPFTSITGNGDFKARFFKKLFTSLRYNDVRLFGNVGMGVVASSLTCGALNVLSGSCLSLAINRLNIKNYRYYFYPSFADTKGAVYISGSMTFSVALIIYCALCSVIKN